jgi:hypothetical protein
VARDDWRLRIELDDEAAGGFATRLGLVDSEAGELADELRDRRLAVTHDGPTVFVYAGSPSGLDAARKAIDAELAELELAPLAIVAEHWLQGEERWDDETAGPDPDAELLAEGYAPWEVRIPCRDHAAARELASRLEADGYGVVRRWRYVIAGCASKAQAEELASRVQGEVEAGGELVWETGAHNPFVVFSGLGGGGIPV